MPASRVNTRELQAPLRERYKGDPSTAQILLTVRNSESDLADPCTAPSVRMPCRG